VPLAACEHARRGTLPTRYSLAAAAFTVATMLSASP
jgi:hypothetical protein